MARNTIDLVLEQKKKVTNIVLVGRSGYGKSSTGNSLLGDRCFKARSQASGVTLESQIGSTVRACGSILNVIDTPAMSDSSLSVGLVRKEIIKCLTMVEEGIHAVLFVLSTRGRITREEECTLNILLDIFGNKIIGYMIVLFTGGDELEADNLTLDQYLSSACSSLQEILRMCESRKVIFDNITMDEDKKVRQVNNLMAHVEMIINQNDGNPFTAEMHRKLKEEAARRRADQKDYEPTNKSTIIEMIDKKPKKSAAVDKKLKRARTFESLK